MSNHCKQCGFPLDEKARSYDQLKRYFAMLNAAFMHWPETHDRQFSSAEELRAWLQMKAGWREIGAEIPLTGLPKHKAMFLAEAAIRGSGSYAVPVFYDDKLVIFKPKSISFAKMKPAEFNALNDAVAIVIEQEIGIRASEILKQTEAAA